MTNIDINPCKPILLSLKAKSGLSFTPSKTLYEVGIVRGVYPYVLPDEYTPAHMISYGYFCADFAFSGYTNDNASALWIVSSALVRCVYRRRCSFVPVASQASHQSAEGDTGDHRHSDPAGTV